MFQIDEVKYVCQHIHVSFHAYLWNEWFSEKKFRLIGFQFFFLRFLISNKNCFHTHCISDIFAVYCFCDGWGKKKSVIAWYKVLNNLHLSQRLWILSFEISSKYNQLQRNVPLERFKIFPFSSDMRLYLEFFSQQYEFLK